MVRKDVQRSLPVTADIDRSTAQSSVTSPGKQQDGAPANSRDCVTTQCPTCHIAVVRGTQVCPIDGTELSDSPAPGLSGQYEFMDMLGHGGMSVVYRAKHVLLGHTVAVKLLNGNSLNNSTIIRRFRQEAAAAKKVEHPNVIHIHDFGITQSGQPYMIMDCLEGQTLQQRIESQGPLSVGEALPVFKQICLALQHLHKNQVLHRDLKPSNVFLTNAGADAGADADAPTVKLVDFGIAKVNDAESTDGNKLTTTGEVFGTPQYMSPEQCLGQSLTPVSDVYSLGCMMYETLAGRPPFEADSPLAMMQHHVKDIPQRLAGRAQDNGLKEIEEIIFRCLEKDPGLRYQSASELLADLNVLEAGYFRSLPLPHKVKSFVYRHKVVLAAVVAFLMITGTGAYFYATRPTDGDNYVKNHWQQWADLTELDLTGHPITGVSMPYIAQLKGLRTLRLNGSNIGHDGVKYISELANLKYLDLSDNSGIDDNGLKQLQNLPGLKILDLAGTNLSPAAMEYLAKLPKLTELYLDSPNLTCSALESTRKLPNLQVLHLTNQTVNAATLRALPANLWGLDLTSAAISDADLQECARFQNLHSLIMNKTNISDAALNAIAKLPNLEYLDLSGTAVTGSGLTHFKDLSHLRTLILRQSSVRSLSGLTGLDGLAELDLSSLGLTDQDFRRLPELKSLERLNIKNNRITANGLSCVGTLKGLKELFVDQETVLSAQGSFDKHAASVLQSLPKFRQVMISSLSEDKKSELRQQVRFGIR